MTYSILNEFTGSSLFPSRKFLEREDFASLAEKTYILLLAMRMALGIQTTKSWADGFLKHTLWGGNFKQWRSNGSDLYVALWALTEGEYEAKLHEPKHLADAPFLRWLRAITHDHEDVTETKRLFLKLDSMLHIQDSSLRAIRRLVQDWPDLTHYDRQLAMTRLLQIMRARTPRAEALRHLTVAARKHDLELRGVCDPESGHGCDDKPHRNLPHPDDLFHKPKKEKVGTALGFLAGLAGLGAGFMGSRALRNENASAGATGAASVASATSALGGDHPGFDSSGHKGIYDTRKAKKPKIIRR
jgi:hypothetical protein